MKDAPISSFTPNAHSPLLLGLTLIMMSNSGCDTPDSTPTSSDTAWFKGQRWSHRMLVFTDQTPGALDQRAVLADREPGLLDRDLLVIEVGAEQATLRTGESTVLPGAEAFRTHFGLPTERFEVVLVGKDGGVKERREVPMKPEELFSIIDAMPMRLDEMRRTQD